MKEEEIESMRKIFANLNEKVQSISKSPRIQALQKRVVDIRKESIKNNKELMKTVQKSFSENDIECFLANDDIEAQKIILDLINQEIESNDKIDKNNVIISKSKSNTLREINFLELMDENGFKVIETDLGDRILQLKKGDNAPVHPTGPASHLTVCDIADIINESM